MLFQRFCPIVIRTTKDDRESTQISDADKNAVPSGNCEGVRREKDVDIVDFMLAMTLLSRIDKNKKIKSKLD